MWITDDITIQTTTSLTTTGGTVWDAARHAVCFLEEMTTAIGLDAPGVKILELGAGCGLLGLTLARNLPGAELVCLTEQANGGALAHLQHNVELNRELLGPVLAAVRTAECDWNDYASTAVEAVSRSECSVLPAEGAGVTCSSNTNKEGAASLRKLGHSPLGRELDSCVQSSGKSSSTGQVVDDRQGLDERLSPTAGTSRTTDDSHGWGANAQQLLANTQWDAIIGSDLIYNPAGARMLPRVLRALSGPHTQVFYTHTKHRFDHLDMDFLQQLEAVGLEWQEVRAPSAQSPPASPPPLSELFPEFRIAVYRITLRHAAQDVNS